MSLSASFSLVEFLRSRTGEALRGAAHYDDDTYDILYIREDVREQYTSAEITQIFATLRQEKQTAQYQERALHLGGHRCSVDVYRDGILMNFIQNDFSGTVISLDASVGSDLLNFIDSCLEELTADEG